MNESYTEWENAETKCQSLGARLPVLDTKQTIDIVKSYLINVDPEEFSALDEWEGREWEGGGRVWLGLIFNPTVPLLRSYFSDPGSGIVLLKSKHFTNVLNLSFQG